jgi:hypothetical protein
MTNMIILFYNRKFDFKKNKNCYTINKKKNIIYVLLNVGKNNFGQLLLNKSTLFVPQKGLLTTRFAERCKYLHKK